MQEDETDHGEHAKAGSPPMGRCVPGLSQGARPRLHIVPRAYHTAHGCSYGSSAHFWLRTPVRRYILESACDADVLDYFESGAPWADNLN